MPEQKIKDMLARNSCLSKVELAKKMVELELYVKELEEEVHYYKYNQDSFELK